MWIILLTLFVLLVVGLIPSLVPEMSIHNTFIEWGLLEPSVLDVFYMELNEKRHLICDEIVLYKTLDDCDITCTFEDDVQVIFHICRNGNHNRKVYLNVEKIMLLGLHGDVECHVVLDEEHRYVLMFDSEDKLYFNIVEM